jgi:hypothetical protein
MNSPDDNDMDLNVENDGYHGADNNNNNNNQDINCDIHMDLSTQHSSQDRAAVERLLGDLTQSESNSNQPSSERPSTLILTPDAQVVHLSQLKI